ncbi:class I SAM-dependent methyltransferase [Sphingomonas sp. PL-96]|uniref:class I SAM-dependent methyltransferase n=1 Tax=Sphingomonas sp. PL-96 TaxID=2887201 RepID=UPI001E3F0FF7|nr:class I SAM-dependent methyltransferase [Sphingomonas sp. PL-96]MCC2975734.1 class I SAM-dependent methyltransferase [Sphingomonas sp. PL-96]
MLPRAEHRGVTSRETTSFLPLAHADGWQDELNRTIVETLMTLGFALIQWPWLLRSLSGGSASAKAALIEDLGLAPDALPNLGSWKADTGYLSLIVDHIKATHPRSVVELGAGASSLVTAKALQRHGGGRLTSLDQHSGFVRATRDWLHDHGVEAALHAVPLRPAPNDWHGAWYDTSPVPDSIDLLLIDGPPWSIHPFVRGAAETLFDRLPVGGTVMLDDAARPGERVIAARWRKRWPNFRFELVNRGTKGTLIGTRVR